ncbi:hypothetical protein D9M70_626240 [compost metagenome]
MRRHALANPNHRFDSLIDEAIHIAGRRQVIRRANSTKPRLHDLGCQVGIELAELADLVSRRNGQRNQLGSR